VPARPQLLTHFSSGLAFALPDDTPESLWMRADRALYRAKASGRSRDLTDDEGSMLAV
jgi:PleD family two-component response regulator